MRTLLHRRRLAASAISAICIAGMWIPGSRLQAHEDDHRGGPGWQRHHDGERHERDNDERDNGDRDRDEGQEHHDHGRHLGWYHGAPPPQQQQQQQRAAAAAAASRAAAHRQQTKNTWRNVAIAAGTVAAYGAIKHNKTLAIAGVAGVLYAASRYEQDRKSQSADARARAALYQRPFFYRDHVRYNRRVVVLRGQRYYQFVRAS